ncbi:SWIM zinc finger family protein [Actinoplanes sp. NPDC023936]|uniref:SWIM zinc finger family protein n=1 Tax=Actinoplanes sp. NPDC023936 TaxID=3154910 RepID=UPI0033DB9B8C
MEVERWSTAQVEALAPDPGSLRNARGVTGRFTASGRLGDILWGLCRGYEVAVDLSGPAFRCSCPSRKIPCKHALALLLRWAESGVAEGEAPEFAGKWQAARSRPKVSTTPDPVAAARRAAERAERVAGGMAELRRWLDDQVEQGLAGFARSGRQAAESMAARLVDAQAPGAAGMLRRLAGAAGAGPHWADRVLGELGLLRLLADGHARLGELDPALAATVRSRIGFPTATEEVLAGPRTTDRWQVLGRVEVDDGALTTRRTWLHGTGTDRFALVLAFAAAGQPLPADLVPGTEFRGDLCFYPGSAPLRALVAERLSAAEPFASPQGAGSIRAALSSWAALLAAEPFRYDGPMLLAGVRPGDGHLVDEEGSALPLAPGHREPWWLLAAAGGHPATVAAEWSPAGLRPLAAWVGGEFVPAASPVPEPGARREPELPAELLAAALVGTARRPWAVGAVAAGSPSVAIGPPGSPSVTTGPPGSPSVTTGPPGSPSVTTGPPGSPSVATGAAALLEAVAVALVCRRAGVEPEAGRAPAPAAPAEVASPLPPAASARLERVLAGGAPGGGHLQQELLAQWLAAAAARGGFVRPALLPALLDAGRRDTTVRPALAQVAGARGAWLAGQRTEWRWLLDEVIPSRADLSALGAWPGRPGGSGGRADSDQGVWETGSGSVRLGLLVALRRADPDRARELVESTWARESPEDRARFLGAFGTGLSLRDEPLLERALDDRRKEVREAALDLLRVLPGAALGRRMAERAHAAVRFDGRRLFVEPPAELDQALGRDGVSAAQVRGVGAGAWLLEEVVAGTPLATWTGLDPDEWVRVARGHDWATPLLHGWAKAAILQHDPAWASALLAAAAGALRESVRWDLHLVLPPDHLARLAAEALRTEDGSAHRLLTLHPGPWPDRLAVVVLETVAARARTDRHTWQLGELCRTAALAMPPGYADLAGRLATELDQSLDPSRVRPVADLARTLTFRNEMLQELQ